MKPKTFLVAGIAVIFLSSSLAALAGPELIVIGNNGPSRPQILRVDAETGTVLKRYSAPQEGLRGIAVDARGDVLLSANILGYGEITHLLDPASAPAMTHPALTMPGNLKVAPGGDVYVISTSGA